MRRDRACRVAGRAFAFGAVFCLAAATFAGAQAIAATTSATSPKAVGTEASLSIEPESGYGNSVLELALLAVSNRTGDPYFAAADVATREQLAVYLCRALWLPDVPALAFGDVGAADWGYKKIGAVVDAGLMQGTSSNTFSPDAPVSRQEAMAAVIATLRYTAESKGVSLAVSLDVVQVSSWLAGFRDRDMIDDRYSSAVAAAYSLGLFDDPAGGWLLPRLAMTHQELLGMLERALVRPLVSKTALPAAVEAVDAYPKLSRGSKGSLVLMVQQRLNALTYYCGAPDGKYSSRTRDAIYAFQKYERLKRTGVMNAADWSRFWGAGAPVPVHAGDYGRRVEVDLTRQVMMLIRDNAVFMTVHVSTGKYGTPTGDWRIRTRSHGWRPTSLGPIYSPAYFMPKNAIHGYPSVPLYPASHGCVRTPIWIEDRIVNELEMGELVHVFYNKAK